MILDSIILIFLLIALAYGAWFGLTKLIKHFGYVFSFVIALGVAFVLYEPLGKKLFFILPKDLPKIVAFDLIFAVLFIAGYKLNKMINERWLDQKIQSKALERLFGGIVGLILMIIIIWLGLVVMISSKPLPERHLTMIKESGMAKTLIYGSGSLRRILPANFITNYRKIIYNE